ncbi:MAG: hypothetical protein ACXQTQ_04580 [Candidatus Hecatellaceae archaeon]
MYGFMVKTTIMLDDDLYKKLVQEALERYGTTKKLSYLINLKLREKAPVKRKRERLTFKLGRKLTVKQVERMIEEGLEEVAV